MEAHALAMHTSMQASHLECSYTKVVIICPSFTGEQTTSVNCGYTVTAEKIPSTRTTSIMSGC